MSEGCEVFGCVFVCVFVCDSVSMCDDPESMDVTLEARGKDAYGFVSEFCLCSLLLRLLPLLVLFLEPGGRPLFLAIINGQEETV